MFKYINWVEIPILTVVFIIPLLKEFQEHDRLINILRLYLQQIRETPTSPGAFLSPRSHFMLWLYMHWNLTMIFARTQYIKDNFSSLIWGFCLEASLKIRSRRAHKLGVLLLKTNSYNIISNCLTRPWRKYAKQSWNSSKWRKFRSRQKTKQDKDIFKTDEVPLLTIVFSSLKAAWVQMHISFFLYLHGHVIYLLRVRM